MKKVLIIDTSILCVWLGVPGKETCGKETDRWDKARVEEKIKQETDSKTTLVLPLAVIIETGNHISQSNKFRYELAKKLAEIMVDTADEKTPWAVFTQQSELWNEAGLKQLATVWINRVQQGDSIGDVTISTVANYYYGRGYSVEILTGDDGLKAYEPIPPVPQPRRRSDRRS